MDSNDEWLQRRLDEYQANMNDMFEAIEESEELEKLGQGFMSAEPLEEVDIGNGTIPRPTFVRQNLEADYKHELIELIKEYMALNWRSGTGLLLLGVVILLRMQNSASGPDFF